MISRDYALELSYRIQENIRLNEHDYFSSVNRLASGNKYIDAADDPSRYSLSVKLGGNTYLNQPRIRNYKEAVSLLQTADSSYYEIQDIVLNVIGLLQQGASSNLSTPERTNIQSEINQLLYEIDRIAQKTQYNNYNLLGFDDKTNEYIDTTTNAYMDLTLGMSGVDNDWDGDGIADWTQTAEESFAAEVERIANIAAKRIYALTGWANQDTTDFTIILQNNTALGDADQPASANATLLEFNCAYWLGGKTPNPFSLEQIITHELTHSIMLRENNTASTDIPDWQDLWFIEGAATWVADDGDTRMDNGANTLDFGLTNETTALISFWRGMGNPTFDSNDYSESFLAFKFLEEKYGANKIRDMLKLIETPGTSAQTALTTTFPEYSNIADFESDFQVWAQNYINQENYNRISTNGISPVSTDFLPKVLREFESNYNVSKFNFETFNMMLGSIDYLGYVNVNSPEDAERSIITAKNSLNVIQMARIKTQTSIYGLQNEIQNEMNMFNGEYHFRNEMGTEEFTKESIELVLNKMMSSSSKNLLKIGNLTAEKVFSVLFGDTSYNNNLLNNTQTEELNFYNKDYLSQLFGDNFLTAVS